MLRPVVLVLAGYYLPGYKAGGPVRSISNLVEALGDEFDFRIVAYDRDLGDRQPYDSAVYDSWNEAGKARVWWVRPGPQSAAEVGRAVADSKHDLLYLNSFFHPIFGFGALRYRSKPILCAPRGQFGPGAMRLGALKKKTLVRLLAMRGAYKSLSWQATDESEVQDILGIIPHSKKESICLAPNLAESPGREPPSFSTKEPGSLRVCFLSRISPKKNLQGALRIVARLNGQISFTVFGPLEDEEYGKRCLSALKDLPANVDANYGGALSHDEVKAALANNDVLLLPTLGENFGHAIYEALSAGLPVVIGDRTPWKDLAASKAGAEISVDDEDRFVERVQSFVEMAPQEFKEWSMGAWLRACSYSANSGALEATRSMFADLLSRTI